MTGSDSLHERCRGALLGAAVGDCLGAPMEGHRGAVPASVLDALDLEDGSLPFTDDTAMTIAVAESILFRKGLDEDHLAVTFAARFGQDPHRGYGPGTAALLARIAEEGSDWRSAATAQFGGRGSHGNGAAMRVAAVALEADGDPARAAELARRSATVTHAHPHGIEGAALQAAAIAIAFSSGESEQPLQVTSLFSALAALTADASYRQRLDEAQAIAATESFGEVATLGTGVAALDSVPTAVCAFALHPDSFRDAVRCAIGLGGDTDTIASMTGAMSGARVGASGIPPHWLARSEGTYRLSEIADRFAIRLLQM